MKKGIGFYIGICLVLIICICTGAGLLKEKQAEFGMIKNENGFTSQLAECNGKEYVIYRNTEQSGFQVADTGKNLDEFQIVGTVHGDRIYTICSYHSQGAQLFGIEPVELHEGEEWKIPTFAAEGVFLAASGTESEIMISILGTDARTITNHVFQIGNTKMEWMQKDMFTLSEGHFVVSALYDEDTLLIMQEDGSVYECGVVMREADKAWKERMLDAVYCTTIAEEAENVWTLKHIQNALFLYALPCGLIALLLAFILFGNRQIVYRILGYTEISCLVCLAAAGILLTTQAKEQALSNMRVEASVSLKELQQKQKADATVDAEGYQSVVADAGEKMEDVLIVKTDSSEVVISNQIPAGERATSFYGDTLAEFLEKNKNEMGTVLECLHVNQSEVYVVFSRNWSDMSADTMTLAVLSKDMVYETISAVTGDIWSMIAVLMAGVTIVHIVIYVWYAKRWNVFLKAVNYVAAEKKAYEDIPQKQGGLQGAWSSLAIIGKNMASLRYERDLLYNNYDRFVPKHMEKLLGKNDIAEIELGDCNKINGCMVHFHLESLKEFDASDYIKTMQESFSLMHQSESKYGGIFVSAATDLSSRKVFFEQDAKTALQFAIDVIHAHRDRECFSEKAFMLLLHAGEYEYGISGVEHRMMPFVYCKEEKLLEQYTEDLLQARVKLVLTEQTWNTMKTDFSMRYIGFLQDDSTEKIRLYECMDAYTEKRRTLMKSVEEIFQNALDLFYSDNLYLARNTFNDVLKIDEEDEVARWYLFHCEYHLNHPEEEIRYGLFQNTIID